MGDQIVMGGITGVVLAGGAGRRMGGLDKGLMLLRGRPLVGWVLDRLGAQVDEIVVSANRNLDQYRAFGHPVISDAVAEAGGDCAGPLAGLHAGLHAAHHPLVLTVPCDSPFFPTNLASRLLAACLKTRADLAVARAGGRRHPVFALYRRSLSPNLAAFLQRGGRKLGAWHTTLQAVEVDFEGEAEAFANINTPDELSAFE